MAQAEHPGPADLVAAARRGGVRDERVLAAVGAVRRERFVPDDLVRSAYCDSALPIGYGQFTSQPSLVARMVEALALRGEEKALEVGTGYGYQTALLAREVWSIELSGALARVAQASLAEANVTNAHVLIGDGTYGVPDEAPFEAIVVTAAHPRVPPPLAAQLAPSGRLVQPIGPGGAERVCVFEKRAGALAHIATIAQARFVKLHGEYGYAG